MKNAFPRPPGGGKQPFCNAPVTHSLLKSVSVLLLAGLLPAPACHAATSPHALTAASIPAPPDPRLPHPLPGHDCFCMAGVGWSWRKEPPPEGSYYHALLYDGSLGRVYPPFPDFQDTALYTTYETPADLWPQLQHAQDRPAPQLDQPYPADIRTMHTLISDTLKSPSTGNSHLLLYCAQATQLYLSRLLAGLHILPLEKWACPDPAECRCFPFLQSLFKSRHIYLTGDRIGEEWCSHLSDSERFALWRIAAELTPAQMSPDIEVGMVEAAELRFAGSEAAALRARMRARALLASQDRWRRTPFEVLCSGRPSAGAPGLILWGALLLAEQDPTLLLHLPPLQGSFGTPLPDLEERLKACSMAVWELLLEGWLKSYIPDDIRQLIVNFTDLSSNLAAARKHYTNYLRDWMLLPGEYIYPNPPTPSSGRLHKEIQPENYDPKVCRSTVVDILHWTHLRKEGLESWLKKQYPEKYCGASGRGQEWIRSPYM